MATERTADALRASIRRFVQEVAAGDAKQRELQAAQRAAVAEFLAVLVEDLRPALPALSGRIPVGYTAVPSAESGKLDEAHQHAEVRGFLLAGEDRPKKDSPGAEQGLYRGRGVWVLESGSLAEVTFTGTWSKGGTARWTAQLQPITTQQVAEVFRLDTVLERVADTLTSYAASSPRRLEQLEDNAARVRALTTLLKR